MRDADGNLFEFCYTEGRNDVPIAVRMNGRVTGEIRPVDGGWQYSPKGQKTGGDVFKTVTELQYDLVGIEPPVKGE